MLKHTKNQSLIARAIGSHKSFVTLSLVAGFVSLLSTGCVNSSSEVELFAPAAIECVVDAGGGVGIKTGGSSGGSTTVQTLVNFNVNPSSPPAYTLDASGQPIPVSSGVTEIGVVMRNTLKSTTSYTSIGANGELRIDQNSFEAAKVVYEILGDAGGLGKGLKLAPKELTTIVPTSGNVTTIVPFLDPSLPDDKAFIQAVGTKKTTISVRMHIEGALRGGQKLTTSGVDLTVQLNSAKYTTFVCAKISKG